MLLILCSFLDEEHVLFLIAYSLLWWLSKLSTLAILLNEHGWVYVVLVHPRGILFWVIHPEILLGVSTRRNNCISSLRCWHLKIVALTVSWVVISHTQRVLLVLSKRSKPMSLVTLLQLWVMWLCPYKRQVVASSICSMLHTELTRSTPGSIDHLRIVCVSLSVDLVA
jgi:hypothetical protein